MLQVILVCGGVYEFTFGVCFARIVFILGVFWVLVCWLCVRLRLWCKIIRLV